MNDKSFEYELDNVLTIIRGVLIDKRAAYGPSNLTDFGELGIVVRMSDKFHRLKNMVQQGVEPEGEGRSDAYLDIAGYAILALIDREGMK